MGFQSRLALLEPAETWPSMESAAWERFWDALELLTGTEKRNTGSLYLLGYVVEITLKVAFFRLRNWPTASPIRLHAIKTHASWQGKNAHDLTALVDILVAESHEPGRTRFDPVFAGALKRHVANMVSHWRETIRYRYTAASHAEVVEAYESADWLLANRHLLWR